MIPEIGDKKLMVQKQFVTFEAAVCHALKIISFWVSELYAFIRCLFFCELFQKLIFEAITSGFHAISSSVCQMFFQFLISCIYAEIETSRECGTDTLFLVLTIRWRDGVQ